MKKSPALPTYFLQVVTLTHFFSYALQQNYSALFEVVLGLYFSILDFNCTSGCKTTTNEQCSLLQFCQGFGFICEMCRKPDIIFPYQLGKVAVCQSRFNFKLLYPCYNH